MRAVQINSKDKRFDLFVQFQKNHPDSHFFQSGLYYQFIDGILNYDPTLLVCEDEDGKIIGSLIAVNQSENYKLFKFLTTRTIISGGPLIDPSHHDRNSIISSLLTELIFVTKRHTNIIQFRNFFNLSDFIQVFNNNKFRFEDHLNLITTTPNETLIWANLSENRRRQIKKSKTNGAIVIQDPSIKEFHQFYLILKDLYNLKVQKPLPGWPLFEKFYYSTINESIGIINLIKYNEKIIGGIMCPVTPGKALHEWYVCGLDKKFNPKGIYPSTLATWSAIEYASKNNIPVFDFMGMGHPKTDYGVRNFKVRFGGKLVNHGRFERINNYQLYLISFIGYKLFFYYNYLFTKLRKIGLLIKTNPLFGHTKNQVIINKENKPGCIVIEGHVQGLANARALGKEGIAVYIVDSKNNIGRYSKYCKKFIISPDFKSKEFADFLINIAETDNLTGWMILPSNDHALLTLSTYKSALEKFYKIITPDYPTVQQICVKTNLIKLSEKLKIGVPKTYFFSDVDSSGFKDFAYPVLTKGNESLSFYKVYKKKAFVSNNPVEFLSNMKSIDQQIPIDQTFTQEIIPTDGENKTLSFTAFAINGEIKTHWVGKKIREHPIKFGTATFCESIIEERLLKPSQKILKKLNYTGVCEIEYLKDPRDNEFKIIEINARTWLWVELAIKSGINFPLIIYNYLNKIDQQYPKNYKPGLKWMNYITDSFFSLRAIFNKELSLITYLKSFKGKILFAVFSYSDPKPFFRMLTMLFYIARNRLF